MICCILSYRTPGFVTLCPLSPTNTSQVVLQRTCSCGPSLLSLSVIHLPPHLCGPLPLSLVLPPLMALRTQRSDLTITELKGKPTGEKLCDLAFFPLLWAA